MTEYVPDRTDEPGDADDRWDRATSRANRRRERREFRDRDEDIEYVRVERDKTAKADDAA